MKQRTSCVLLLLTLLWLPGCQQRKEPSQATPEADLSELPPPPTMADTVMNTGKTSELGLASPPPALPKNRQFVRSAQLKVRVAGVVSAVEQIERITAQQGGFVTGTKLSSQVYESSSVAVSADSLLETTSYTVSDTMTLRVPNAHLDTTLHLLARLSDFIDYRAVQADDVTLQRLANAQIRRRTATHDQRLRNALAQPGRKPATTADIEENRFMHQQQADDAQLNDLALADKMQFSNVSLIVYQRPVVQRVMLPRADDVPKYTPSLLPRVREAFVNGGTLLIDFLLLILESWGLIVFGLLAYLGFRYVGRRFRRQPQGSAGKQGTLSN